MSLLMTDAFQTIIPFIKWIIIIGKKELFREKQQQFGFYYQR